MEFWREKRSGCERKSERKGTETAGRSCVILRGNGLIVVGQPVDMALGALLGDEEFREVVIAEFDERGNNELVLTPAFVSDNTDWGRNAVRKHMMTLGEHGLVEYYDEERAVYQLSERGPAWLAGEIASDDLE